MKKSMSNIAIVVSLLIGSFLAFCFYFDKYLSIESGIAEQIKTLLPDTYVLQDKYKVFLFGLCALAVILFWLLGFIVYKVIFKIAKVRVEDFSLLIALGSAYTISFLVSYFLIGYINFILLTIIANMLEVVVIYFALYDRIKQGFIKCIVLRSILLVFNILIAIMKM